MFDCSDATEVIFAFEVIDVIELLFDLSDVFDANELLFDLSDVFDAIDAIDAIGVRGVSTLG
jgi:hypothetical protein